MSQRIAALDLGTNTFHLLIADVSDDGIERVIHSEQKHVKLGEGGISQGIITEASFQRGLKALHEFKISIDSFQVDQIRAVGTAALRTASNGADFINRVEIETQILIQIIDGDKEAALIFRGVKHAVDLTECSLIMDIGGGSVEFIIADAMAIQWKKSFPIGAAKLMAMFHHSDPIADIEIAALYDHLNQVLEDLRIKCLEFRPKALVGSAGAFETFASLCQIKAHGNEQIIGRMFSFEMKALKEVLQELLVSRHEDRANNIAILHVRTDMIVVAAVLTHYIITETKLSKVKLSTFALKEGLLLDTLYSW